jgi:RNA polymerase subunit RPABC4/transcription elongation factor Spt4
VALKAFCTTCQRTVYIEEGDTPVCPVCSSPLIQTTTDADEDSETETAK